MKKIFLSLALVCMVALGAQAKTYDLSTYDTSCQIELKSGDVITGKANVLLFLTVNAEATITMDNAIINDGSLDDESKGYAGITAWANLTIILKGDQNRAQASASHYPGIYIEPGKTLTIKEHADGGSLYARGGKYGAGIGGSDQRDCGSIKIFGGVIDAYGLSAPGIGTGNGRSCGSIEIYGREVTGRALNNPVDCGAAGIGGGEGSSVTAIFIENVDNEIHSIYAEKGANAEYVIGKGKNGSVGSIEIQGINVTYTDKGGIAPTESNWYWYNGKAEVLQPQLEATINEMIVLYTLAKSYVSQSESDAFYKEIQKAQAINHMILSYDEMEAKVAEVQATLADAEAKLLAASKEAAKTELDGLLDKDDSEACKTIITNAKADVDALTWNDTKGVSDNVMALINANNTIQGNAKTNLMAQRITDKKAELSLTKADVGDMYDYAEDEDLSAELKGNLNTLYGALDATIASTVFSNTDYENFIKAYNEEFIMYWSYMQAVINEKKALLYESLDLLGKPGDSDAVKKIISDAKAAVNAFAIDTDMTGMENINAMDALFSEAWYRDEVMKAVEEERAKEATGIENLTANGQEPTALKVLRDGQLFIMMDGKIYDAQGAEVK